MNSTGNGSYRLGFSLSLIAAGGTAMYFIVGGPAG